MTKQQPSANEASYFDLITEGVGYLNRLRTVSKRGCKPYDAITIKAIVGPSDSVEYREFDLIVVGKQAHVALSIIGDAIEQKKKVFAGFRSGDARPEEYTFNFKDRLTGEAKSERRFCIKGRLLQLTWVKVDGQDVEIPLVERPEVAKTGTDGQ
jgi:Protein of unknown function (DUF3577)